MWNKKGVGLSIGKPDKPPPPKPKEPDFGDFPGMEPSSKQPVYEAPQRSYKNYNQIKKSPFDGKEEDDDMFPSMEPTRQQKPAYQAPRRGN